MDSKTARIRALNDELRQNFAGGAAVMTPGIAALGAEAVARIVGRAVTNHVAIRQGTAAEHPTHFRKLCINRRTPVLKADQGRLQ